jgi:hypothetical protein
MPLTLFTHIDQLPLRVFLSCLLEGRLKELIVNGAPDEDQVQEQWAKLYAQYVELTGSEASQYVLFLQRDAALLRWRITALSGAVALLRIAHEEAVVQLLKELGQNVSDLAEGHPGYSRALSLIEAQLPALRIRLEAKEVELGESAEDIRDGEPVTIENFHSWCVRLSRFMHQAIEVETVMTGRYARMVKEYIAYYTQKANAHEKETE